MRRCGNGIGPETSPRTLGGAAEGVIAAQRPELAPKALQGVNASRLCPGCGGTFQPTRRDQRHCRPGCRVLALRNRERSSALDLLAQGIAAGHVEPDVMPDRHSDRCI